MTRKEIYIVEKDTNKQKKKTSTNGSTGSVTHSLNQESKEENKQKSPSNYGFDGLLRIFHSQEIDTNDWIIKSIDKERGGIEFMLPSAEGEIYLGWEDLYKVKVTFVRSKNTFDETCNLSNVHEVIDMLEQQRIRNKAMLIDMIKEKFVTTEEREDGKPF